MAIVTRAAKGSALTWEEMDTNFLSILGVDNIHAAAEKSLPVDADEFLLVDSANSFQMKKITWAEKKAAFKTYFDTLYQAAGSYLTSTSIGVTVQGYNVNTIAVAPGASGNVLTSNGTSWTSTTPAVSSSSVLVRQTVISGPVDSSGLSAFGGSTGSTTVTASGTIKVTCFAGGDANYTGSVTNPAWTGLSTNGTMYLYAEITSGGVVTQGSSTLQWVVQRGGTPSTVNGQHTINIAEGKVYCGNGSTAPQVYRVLVGEVTVTGGNVSVIIWYSLEGKYDSGWISTLVSAAVVSKNHNIGSDLCTGELTLKNLTAEFGYSQGDIIKAFCDGSTGASYPAVAAIPARNTISHPYVAVWQARNKASSASQNLTAANWAYRLTANRGW